MADGIEIQGLDAVVSRLRSLPDESRQAVLLDVAAHSLDVLRAEEAPKKYVTRKAAYGQTFQSDKQRRWFFASLRSGAIKVPYGRTGGMLAAWEAQVGASEVVFTNKTPGAQYVIGDSQSRHEKMVGWKTIRQTLDGKLSFRSSKFRDVVMKALQRAIRRLQLG